jgi:hypothetical protein
VDEQSKPANTVGTKQPLRQRRLSVRLSIGIVICVLIVVGAILFVLLRTKGESDQTNQQLIYGEQTTSKNVVVEGTGGLDRLEKEGSLSELKQALAKVDKQSDEYSLILLNILTFCQLKSDLECIVTYTDRAIEESKHEAAIAGYIAQENVYLERNATEAANAAKSSREEYASQNNVKLQETGM